MQYLLLVNKYIKITVFVGKDRAFDQAIELDCYCYIVKAWRSSFRILRSTISSFESPFRPIYSFFSVIQELLLVFSIAHEISLHTNRVTPLQGFPTIGNRGSSVNYVFFLAGGSLRDQAFESKPVDLESLQLK